MELEYDTDTMVFYALRVFRNAFISYCRSRLTLKFGDRLDDEIRSLYKKEWDDIERSAREAHESGAVSRIPIDALDYLSVNHTYVLLEKYWEYLSPVSEASTGEAKRIRSQLTSWARELIGIRNPVSHAPEESLAVRDALRYIDSAARILGVLRVPEANQLREQWNGLVADLSTTSAIPPSIIDTLPSREQITTDFIGREDHLTDLWRWLGEDTRHIWALVGDGGKGKTTIAYEFASQARAVLQQFNLQGVLWLSAKKKRFVEGATVPVGSADFSDLNTALDWVLTALGWADDTSQPAAMKLARAVELLDEFPMFIVADDIDSLDMEDEQAVEFFAQHIPRTRSKALLTSRRSIFGLGSCSTRVAGMSETEVAAFLAKRADVVGLSLTRLREIWSVGYVK